VMRAAPDELSTTFLALPAMGPGAEPSAQLLVCYAGDDEQAGRAAIAPLLELPGVTGSDISRRPYLDLVQEAMAPPPVRMVGGHGFADFDDEVIADYAAAVTGFAGPTVASVRYLGGAFSRVDPDATAFAIRDREVMLFRVVMLPPDAAPELVEAAAAPWQPMHAHITSTYGNFIESADPSQLPLIYPPKTLERLRAVKRASDPENVLAPTHNIVSSRPGAACVSSRAASSACAAWMRASRPASARSPRAPLPWVRPPWGPPPSGRPSSRPRVPRASPRARPSWPTSTRGSSPVSARESRRGWRRRTSRSRPRDSPAPASGRPWPVTRRESPQARRARARAPIRRARVRQARAARARTSVAPLRASAARAGRRRAGRRAWPRAGNARAGPSRPPRPRRSRRCRAPRRACPILRRTPRNQ